MNFEEAEKRLRELAQMSIIEQRERRNEISETFSVFWASDPSREKFSEVVSGLLLTPAMLWMMVKQ